MKILRNIIFVSLIFASLPIKAINSQEYTPEFKSTSVIAIDSENGQILYDYNSDIELEIGSISKLLTVYTVMESVHNNLNLNESSALAISDQAYELSQNYDISNVPLRQDETYSIEELVESIAINLANGSALALAEFVAEKEEDFVNLMEKTLQEWGLSRFQLHNATGLPINQEIGPTNSMTAEAVAIIAYHLINEYPGYLEYSQKPQAPFRKGTPDQIDMLNYNQMLSGKPYEHQNVLGLMPGYSDKDGSSFVGYAERDNLGVITVILGSETEEMRYEETEQLLDYVYRAYREELVVTANQETSHVGTIPVQGGTIDTAPIVYEEDMSLVIPLIDTTPRLEYSLKIEENLFNDQGKLIAPLEKGTRIGMMTISGVGTEIDYLASTKGNKVSVVLAESIEEAPWYNKAWQNITDSVSNSWESTRRFFVDLFN